MFHRMYKKGAEVLEDFLQRTDGWVENRIDATRQLAACYYAIGEDEKAFSSLTRAFAFDVPRGETCCDIGRHFMDRGKYKQAVYWYTQALSAKKATQSGAFIEEECYGFLPAISLCICYDRMGDREQAYQYNDQQNANSALHQVLQEVPMMYQNDSHYLLYLSHQEA